MISLLLRRTEGARDEEGSCLPKLERSTGPRGMSAPACEWSEPESSLCTSKDAVAGTAGRAIIDAKFKAGLFQFDARQ
jgi:hypothetical protein